MNFISFVLLLLATFLNTLHIHGQVIVSFFDNGLTVREGDQFNVRIAKSGTNDKAFVVIVEVENDADGDFIGVTQVARFDAKASGVATVSFTIKDDDIPEGPEIFYLHLYTLDKSIFVGSPDRLAITIRANDDAYGVFSLDEVSPKLVSEYSYSYVVPIKIKREVSYYDTVNVNFMVNSSSPNAVIGVDVLPAIGMVTFQPQQKEANIELQILADDIPENSESFFVSLTSTSFSEARIIPSLLEIIIAANDAPVHFSKAEYRFEEGPGTKSVVIDVTRGVLSDGTTKIGPVDGDVYVDYNFISASAVINEDFVATNGTLTFSAQDITKTISFVIIDDSVPEEEEYFSLRLLNIRGNAVLVVPSVATVIINANDNPSGIISFKPDISGGAPSQRVNEDTFSSVNFIVVRGAGTFGEVSVSWYITRDSGGSSAITDDVGPSGGTLVFANGANEAVISLTVVQDNTPEPAEMFIIHLRPESVTGSALVEGLITAQLLIEDSDNVYGTIEFGPDTDQKIITNAESRQLRLSVSRSGGRSEYLTANVTVTYDDGNLQIENEDTLVTPSQIITLPAGEDPTTVNFELHQSSFLVMGGKFVAMINNLGFLQVPRFGAYNSPKLGIRQIITVSVALNEANGETGFFNVTSQVVDEPVSGVTQVGLLVSREGLIGQANIRWSITGTDITADDVDALQGILILQPGMSEAFLLVGIKADDTPEITEIANVQLDSIEPSDTQRLRPGSTSMTIIINANDNPGGVLQFSPKMNLSYVITEGGNPIEVIVERSGGALIETEVQYSIIPNGTDQFYGATNILVFSPGKREVSSQILAKLDGIPELTEKYTLILSPVGSPNSVLGNRTSIDITILSNDNPNGVIQFGSNPTTIYTVEGQLGEEINLTIPVSRINGTYGTITVPWALSPSPQDDLIPSSGVLVFQPGQNTQTILLIVKNDDIPEGNETYALQLSTPQGGALPGIPMVATIVIQENDNPVEFVDPIKYVFEPQNVSLIIRRQGRLDKQGSVHYRTLDGSASYLEGDYTQIQPQALTFDIGQQDRVISVVVLDDDTPEGNETFSVQLFDVGGDLITTNKSTATIVILSNDQAYGVFSFDQPTDIQVEEGSTVFYNVIRNRGTFGSVRLYWELRSQNNIPLTPGDDFQTTSGQMDFSPQENKKQLGVTPLADNVPETTEQFFLVLTRVEALDGRTDGNLVSLASSGTVATVRVTSSDDPYGRMAFAADSRDVKIAEDFYPGYESSTQAIFTVERRQGTQNQVKVLWEIFSDQLAGILPAVHDLLFTGRWPSSVPLAQSKQRAGTSTPVAQFSGSPGQYIVVPTEAWPSLKSVPDGFSLSAWLQPFASTDGYILAYATENGNTHFLSLKVTVADTKTTLVLQVSTEIQSNQQLLVETSTLMRDGNWHHVFVAVGSSTASFYLDGQLAGSRSIIGTTLLNGSGVVFVGAQPPGSNLYTGYMQDVRLFMRAMDVNAVSELYHTSPYKDITLISGTLTYPSGVKNQSFTVASQQDIEEEGSEVFAVILLDTTGGASLAVPDSRTTLTVLKSDNANGLFGFSGPCEPSRVLNENGTVTCPIQRTRGDDGSVTVFWVVNEILGQTFQQAAADFDASNGTVVFLPGERQKTLVLQVTDETLPEVDELFNVQLTSVASDDGLVGSTNTSGASVDNTRASSQVVIQANDYPYGLLQFSNKPNAIPPVNVRIEPASSEAEVQVSEEGGLVPLVVQRTQGLLGTVTAEWRTKDLTAFSEGKSPPDYVGGVGRITMGPGVNYAFVNITVKDNSIPEAAKKFQVELINPSGGAVLGPASTVNVTIQASDGAFGIFQFSDTSLSVRGTEDGDEGFNIVSLQVLRLAGSIGTASVSWKAQEDQDDGLDIINQSGILTFQPGETTRSLDLQVRGDTVPELDETVLVKLLVASGGQLGDSLKTTATVVIAANDDPYGKFIITAAFRPLIETEANKDVSIIVQRLGGKYGSVEVDFASLDQSETYVFLPGPVTRADTNDYQPVRGTLSFGPNQEFADFKVHIIDDQLPEQDESIFVRLTSVRLVQAAQLAPVQSSPRFGLDSETYGQIIILSNDDASGRLLLLPANISVDETNLTPAVNVIRTGGALGEVSVSFQVIDGTAVQNVDYIVLTTVVTLSPRETSKRVPFEIVDDRVPEISETFTIQLLNKISGGAVLGDQISTLVTILPSDDPNGVFEFVSKGQTVEEGTQPYTVDITVSRTGGLMDVATVAWTATSSGGSVLDDISPASGSLYFVSNEATRKITLTILPDNIPEGSENFVITLLSATNGRIGEKNTYVLTIAPNDSPYGTVEFSSQSYFVPEDPADGPQIAQIVRRGGTYGTLRVYYSTLPMTVLDMITTDGLKPLDMYAAPLTGVPSETGSQVDVSQSTNSLQGCASACLIESTCNSFSLQQIDIYTVCTWYTKTFSSITLRTSANGNYYEKDQIKLSNLMIGQAKGGEDFNVVSGQFILFGDGQTTAAIPIPIIDDTIPELDEEFYLKLTEVALDDGNISTSDTPLLGQLRQAVITIRSSDSAFGMFRLYSLSAGPSIRVIEVSETNRLAVDLVVERSGGSMGSVSVDWSVSVINRTATYNQDYIADGATLLFSSGQTTRAFAVTILDDSIPEDNEEFTVQLTNPTGGSTLSTLSSIRIVILANDNAAGVLSFEKSSLLVNEGDKTDIKVMRSLPALGNVTVSWLIEGRNGLQVAAAFATYTGTLMFLPAETEKLISLSVLSDDTPEVGEEYSLMLQNIITEGISPSGAATIDPQLGVMLITISGSNDPHGVFQLSQNSLEVRVQENVGTADLLVVRKFGAIGVVRVTYEALQGSLMPLSTHRYPAIAGEDFIAVTPGFIDIGNGVTSGIISISIIDDNIPEIDEVFLLRLINVTLIGSIDNSLPPRLASNETEAEIIIIANDGAPGVIQFSPDSVNVSVTEQGQTISLNVVRGNGTFGQVSVFVSSQDVTQSAIHNLDYNMTDGELVFADGESRKSIEIVILDDPDPEPAETFQVILANPSNGAVLGQAIRAYVTILPNDLSGGVITFDTADTIQLREPTATDPSSSQADIYLRRGPGAFGVVSVPFNITTRLGQVTEDISPQNGMVTFSDGQTTAVLSISAMNDDLPESEETFILTLQTPTGGAVLGDVKSRTIVIAASDSPFGLLQIFTSDSRQSNYSVEEAFTTLKLDVVRSLGMQTQVSVDVVTIPGTATFSASTSRVVLAPLLEAVGVSVSHWCQVTVLNTVYLIMLTSLTSDVQLSSMLPAGSPVGIGQSVVYKWQGQLSYVATISSDGATSALSFTIDNSTYVVIANSGREGRRQVLSQVYRMSASGILEMIQSLPTSGVSDVEHFVYNSRHFLFFTNSLDDTSRSDIYSSLFEWNSDTAMFTVTQKQLVPTFYATAVTSFTIDSQIYVAVANYYDRNTGSYEISSVIFQMGSDFRLVQHQLLNTQGAVSLTYTEIGSMRLLTVANNRQNVISASQDSAVYRWNTTSQTFVLHQTLKTSRAQQVTSLTTDAGISLLVFANSVGNSEIFVWDTQSNQFKSAWKGSPYLSLQPVVVHQPLDTLYLLASASVSKQEASGLFQIALLADGSDFVPRRVTMTFNPNQTLLQTSVVVLSDNIPESSEGFSVSLENPTAGAELGPMKSVAITILTNDDTHGVIEFASDSLSVYVEEKMNADNIVLLNVTRRLGFFGTVTVDWAATGDQSGVADITPLSGQLQFVNGQSVATITLIVKDDKEPEFAEITYVRLNRVIDSATNANTQSTKLGDNIVAVVTVLANDSPYGVVSWEKTSLTVAEPEGTDQSLDLVIIRQQGLEQTIRVDYVTSAASWLPLSQQAVSGEDYVSKQGSVTFAAGVSRGVANVVIKQDSIPEDAETFLVNLTSVSTQSISPGTTGAPSIAVGKGVMEITILANDVSGGVVEMDVQTNVEGRFDVYEETGKNVTIELPLKRTGGNFGPVTVTWLAIPVEATVLDFYPSSGTVTFENQQGNASIVITIIDDVFPENLETFNVMLISVTGSASLGQATSVRVGIKKNDSPNGLFRFATSQVTTHESKNSTDPNGQVRAVVQRVQGTQGIVNIQWRLNVEAASDFLPPLQGTIQFLQGDTEKLIVLQTQPDTNVEGREEFILSLVSADNNADISSTEGDCKIIILPDLDSSGVISVQLESRSVIVGEPGESSPSYSGSAEVKVVRGQGIYGEVMVTWSLTPRDLSAFQQVEGSLMFLDLQQTASIMLQTKDDNIPELHQVFTLQLTSATGGAVISNVTGEYTAAIMFAASDYPHGLIQFSLPEVIVVSEDQGLVSLNVIRDKGLNGQLSVAYTTSQGNATAYEDYIPKSGILTFLAGMNNQTIQVSIVPDVTSEGPEDFYVNLTSVVLMNDTNNYTLVNGLSEDMPPALGNLSVKVVRIDKNDNAEGMIQFSNDTYEVKEESGVAQVLVVRSVGKYGQVTVHYTTAMVTATEGIDYIAASGDLTMPDGVGEILLNITIRDDFEMEPAETFKIILSNVTGGALLGARNTATVTILKSDYPNGRFAFQGPTEINLPNPEQPTNQTFVVERTGGILGQQQVFWRLMGPNNPNQQLEDTSDISSTVDGREVTYGSLTWQNGTLGTQQLVMNIKAYTTWEVEKSFVLQLYRVSGSPVGIGDGEMDTAHGSLVIKIDRFGDPNGIIQFTGVATQFREVLEPDGSSPSQLIFPVTRKSGTGVSGIQQIYWEVRPNSVNNTDIQASSGSIMLEDGTRNGQIILQILPDDVPELNENFSLVLVRVQGGAQLDTQFIQSNFSIRYNDQPHGEFCVISEYQSIEVNSVDLTRQIRLNFTRYQGAFGSVILTFNVQYDISDAGVGVDPSTGTVTFLDGDHQAYSLISIIGKGFVRLNSTFTVYLTNVQFLGSGVTEPPTIRPGCSKAEIKVPALAANTEISFASDLAFVNEGDRTLTVSLIRVGTYGSLAVDWASGYSSADQPVNVTNGIISPLLGSVNFAHGQETANVTVQLIPQVGRVESFVLRLPRIPQSLVSGGAQLAASNLITHADPSGLIRFSDASLRVQVSELEGQVNLTLWRLYGSDSRIAVHFQTSSSNASAEAGDFTAIPDGVVVMDPQQTWANITIQILQDNVPEQTETFFVSLTSVEKYPTPLQPALSPRLSKLYSISQINIKESTDAYGILYLKPTQTNVKESFTVVSLTVVRSGGVFGVVRVTVRTVGGGESWTSQIVPNQGSSTNDTIADVLGKRQSQETATGGQDYDVLNTVIEFQVRETEKVVNVTILEDNQAEPAESVLVYLTEPTGGARVARGASDGGQKGYSVINIAASDYSNGLIGFEESSKNIHVNEDLSPIVTLKLIRLNAFFGEVKVNWKAKRNVTSTDLEDADLSNQLKTTADFTLCPPNKSQCNLTVELIDDDIPEESYSFVVVLLSADTDAQLNNDSLSAMVTIDPSDDVRGLVQFAQNSRILIAGENEQTVQLGVERVKGQKYDVSVAFNTQQMTSSQKVSGVTVYPALETQDFRGQSGSLIFAANSQELKSIDVSLTPVLASNNPLPKQFYIKLSLPTNGARVDSKAGVAIVRIVKEEDIPIWTVVSALQDESLADNSAIIALISQLEKFAESPLSNDGLSIIEDILDKVTNQGNKRKFPTEVVTPIRNLFCKLLDAAINDARRGRTSLVQKLEQFADTLVTNATCPPSANYDIVSTQCANVKISAGRWTPNNILGHTFDIQLKDSFTLPESLPDIGITIDGTSDQCVDFHLLEYSSQIWFRTTTNPDDVMHDRIIGFGLRGHESGRIQFPVKYTIHTPDRRVAAKDARCVYYDDGSDKWVSPADVCKVLNDLTSGQDDFVECECDHMSSYGVIATTHSENIIGYVVWFYVVCFICMGSMVIAVAVHHLCFSKATFSASVHMHFLMAIFFTQMSLVIDAFLSPDDILAYNVQEDNSRCIAMGLFLHYFFLAQFTWITTQAINLWKVLIMNDEHSDRHYVIFFIIGWGVPVILVAIFYAVTFNIFKYHTDLSVDFIYGDVNKNGEICFITNGYSALGGILVPALFAALVVGIVFVKAYQLSSQWYFYDDVYRGRPNSQEIPFLLVIWGVLLIAYLWLALHMIYGYLWMMILFCIFNLILALIVFILYAVIRNPLFACIFGPVKASYSVTGDDADTYSTPVLDYSLYAPTASIKGSQASLLNESWENNTDENRSRMTVKRTLSSQVYMNPPVAIISPAATIDSDSPEFDDLIYALKLGRSLTPSEFSRSFDDDMSQLSIALEQYETKRINIADTHV